MFMKHHGIAAQYSTFIDTTTRSTLSTMLHVSTCFLCVGLKSAKCTVGEASDEFARDQSFAARSDLMIRRTGLGWAKVIGFATFTESQRQITVSIHSRSNIHPNEAADTTMIFLPV